MGTSSFLTVPQIKVANASSASVSSLTVSDGLNFALFDLGTARDNGMFQAQKNGTIPAANIDPISSSAPWEVCYCASHESEARPGHHICRRLLPVFHLNHPLIWIAAFRNVMKCMLFQYHPQDTDSQLCSTAAEFTHSAPRWSNDLDNPCNGRNSRMIFLLGLNKHRQSHRQKSKESFN